MNKLLRFTFVFTALLAMASTDGASMELLGSTPMVAQEKNCTISACDMPFVDIPLRPATSEWKTGAGQKVIPSTTQPAYAHPCESDGPKRKCKVEGELVYEDGCLTGTVTCKGKGITITIEIDTCEDDGGQS